MFRLKNNEVCFTNKKNVQYNMMNGYVLLNYHLFYYYLVILVKFYSFILIILELRGLTTGGVWGIDPPMSCIYTYIVLYLQTVQI